jgi:hypothetical protein
MTMSDAKLRVLCELEAGGGPSPKFHKRFV